MKSAAVFDATEQDFESTVMARSREVPVVVDFWAPWCGPCRTLGPTLEKLANEAQGGFVLAKVNVDENQRLAAAFRVQGIPAVKAVRDGQVIDEFTGALPESRVRAWLKNFVAAPGDDLVAAAAALEQRDPQEAAARYRLVLGQNPHHATALFGLGRVLMKLGDPEALAVLRDVPTDSPLFARAQAIMEARDFFEQSPDPAELEARVAAEPKDLEARYALAAGLIARGEEAAAMDHLLYIVQRNRALFDDGARKALLAVLALLGDEHALVADYRRRLANALF